MTQFNVLCYLDTGFIRHVSSFSYECIGTCRSKAQLCVQLLNLYIPLPAVLALVAIVDYCVGQLPVRGSVVVQGF